MTTPTRKPATPQKSVAMAPAFTTPSAYPVPSSARGRPLVAFIWRWPIATTPARQAKTKIQAWTAMGAACALAAMAMNRIDPAMRESITAHADRVIVPGGVVPGALDTAISSFPCYWLPRCRTAERASAFQPRPECPAYKNLIMGMGLGNIRQLAALQNVTLSQLSRGRRGQPVAPGMARKHSRSDRPH